MLGTEKRILLKVLAIVVCMVVWLCYAGSFFWTKTPSSNTNEITIGQQLGSGRWEVVSGGLVGDIRRIAFDKSGKLGVAISLEGDLLSSQNGGLTWNSAGKMSFSSDGGESWTNDPDMELVNGLAITDKGVFIGTAVDESLYGAVYQLESSGNWKVQAGSYGGILSASNSVMIGSNGLIVKLTLGLNDPQSSGVSPNNQNQDNPKKNTINSQDIAFQQLPLWARINLYSIDQKDQNLLVAGDYGFVCSSDDNGKAWKNISPDKGNKLPLYASALGEEMGLVGGSGGTFWRLNKKTESWQQIVGLKKSLTIFAMYADNKGQCVAAGGDEIGNLPFILYSSDDGLSWQYELIPQNYGRISSISKSSNGIFVTTIDGHILLRKNSTK